tara:strand:+ start:2080 stop:3204 length:1125 start_codon:yes stop_codon:yes gene_type:complete
MGSNLSQVFISNALTMLDGSQAQFGSLAGAAAADDVGVFTLGPGTPEYKQTKLYVSTVDTDTSNADDTTVGASTIASPIWLYHSFQIVQRAVTGNVIASPIITAGSVKRISYTNHTPSVAEFNTLDIAASAITGDEVQVKFVVRTAPVDYLNFAEPGNAINDITGDGKVCPLAINNNTHHKVFTLVSLPADRLAATAAADDELGLYDDILAKINAHSVLKDLLKPTDNGTSGLKIETRFAHVTVDMIYNNIGDDEAVTSTESGYVAKTAFVAGAGNDWQVSADELRCRSRQGNFNRMYFPQTIDTYVTNGHAYDKIVIEYETPSWPNGAGIAPAGGMNQAIIYYSNEGTDPGTTATEFDDVFGYAVGTDKEFRW